jgi:hypothetical protein
MGERIGFSRLQQARTTPAPSFRRSGIGSRPRIARPALEAGRTKPAAPLLPEHRQTPRIRDCIRMERFLPELHTFAISKAKICVLQRTSGRPRDICKTQSQSRSVWKILRQKARFRHLLEVACFLVTLQGAWQASLRRVSPKPASRSQNRDAPSIKIAETKTPERPPRHMSSFPPQMTYPRRAFSLLLPKPLSRPFSSRLRCALVRAASTCAEDVSQSDLRKQKRPAA